MGIVVERVCRVGGQAIELPGITVEGIRSGFRDHIDDAAGGPPELRVEVVRDHAEFLHGILRNEEADSGIEDIHVLHAVQQDFRARFSLPIDAETYAPIAYGVLTAPAAELRVIGG